MTESRQPVTENNRAAKNRFLNGHSRLLSIDWLNNWLTELSWANYLGGFPPMNSLRCDKKEQGTCLTLWRRECLARRFLSRTTVFCAEFRVDFFEISRSILFWDDFKHRWIRITKRDGQWSNQRAPHLALSGTSRRKHLFIYLKEFRLLFKKKPAVADFEKLKWAWKKDYSSTRFWETNRIHWECLGDTAQIGHCRTALRAGWVCVPTVPCAACAFDTHLHHAAHCTRRFWLESLSTLLAAPHAARFSLSRTPNSQHTQSPES